MISTVLWGAFSFGYVIVSIAYVLAVFLFIGYALKLVVDDVNWRYGIFGFWKKHRIYKEDAQDAFLSEDISADYYNKEITLCSSCIEESGIPDLEIFAIEFGKIHHPHLKVYLCTEKGRGVYIRYREEMTVREIKESEVYGEEIQNTSPGE